MEKYDNLGLVGEGSYGMVIKCKHKDTGQLVAIKKFLESEDDKMVKKIAMREVRMLKQLRHDHLVNLIEVFRKKKRLYLVFEFVDHTVLDELEKCPNGLDENTVRKILWQVLKGIEFCHAHNIIHRDIKPENILVSKTGVVKLCDFGFARTLAQPGESYTDYVATRWYRAPELLVGDTKYGRAVDIWAVGCLLAEMLTGEPLFPGDSDIDQLYHIVKVFGNLTQRHKEVFLRNPLFVGMRLPEVREIVPLEKKFSRISSHALDLMKQCLKLDQDNRPTCSELLKHDIFLKEGFSTKFSGDMRDKIRKEHLDNPLLKKQFLLDAHEEEGSADTSSKVTPKKKKISVKESKESKEAKDTTLMAKASKEKRGSKEKDTTDSKDAKRTTSKENRKNSNNDEKPKKKPEPEKSKRPTPTIIRDSISLPPATIPAPAPSNSNTKHHHHQQQQQQQQQPQQQQHLQHQQQPDNLRETTPEDTSAPVNNNQSTSSIPPINPSGQNLHSSQSISSVNSPSHTSSSVNLASVNNISLSSNFTSSYTGPQSNRTTDKIVKKSTVLIQSNSKKSVAPNHHSMSISPQPLQSEKSSIYEKTYERSKTNIKTDLKRDTISLPEVKGAEVSSRAKEKGEKPKKSTISTIPHIMNLEPFSQTPASQVGGFHGRISYKQF